MPSVWYFLEFAANLNDFFQPTSTGFFDSTDEPGSVNHELLNSATRGPTSQATDRVRLRARKAALSAESAA